MSKKSSNAKTTKRKKGQQQRRSGLSSAIKKQQQLPSAVNNLLKQAYTLHQQSRISDAAQGYQKVLIEYPAHAETNFLFGLLLYNQGQLIEAESMLKRALEVQPLETRYLNALGVLNLRLGRFQDAELIFEKLHNLSPRDFDPLFNLGTARSKLQKFSCAAKDLEKALAFKPRHTGVLNNLGNAYQGLCQIEKSSEYYLKAFEEDKTLFPALSNYLVNTHYQHKYSPSQILTVHVDAAKHFPTADMPLGDSSEVQHRTDKQHKAKEQQARKQKIRVGYFSADFRTHSVAYFLMPLLANHDKERVEIFCYYNADKVDEITQKFQSIADKWIQTSSLSTDQLVEQVRSHNLDIAIDLAGHTSQNRLEAFARRMAPIQINWLGYPHSTGIPAMDFRIVDEITDPTGTYDDYSSETLLRLPNGFLCYQGDDKLSYQEELPCLSSAAKNNSFTFGSFNNFAKVSDEVIATWIEILLRLPDARIIIKAKQLSEDSVQQDVLGKFKQHGIDAERIQMLATLPSATDHLALYNKIDLALDAFPYNGTTTTCEALWMGVPTITFLGDRHAARVSASILSQCGLEQFIAKDISDYIEKAVDFAQHRQTLANIRPTLRDKVKASSLCDEKSFTAEMENLYYSLVETHS